MQKRQNVSQKFAYWLKVVSLGMILGLGLQFAQAWTAPTVAPPGGNVGGPVTTGGNQTKTGSLTTSGLSAPSFVDSDNAARYVNPSGTSVLSSLTLASLPTCDLKTDASGAVYCGTDAAGGGGVSGSGTANYLPRWSAATNLVDSVLYQHGANVVIGGTNSLGYKLNVSGTIGATGNITTSGKVYSAATLAGDGASTLTTKGYVDGKVGGGGVDSGVWCGLNARGYAYFPCKGQDVCFVDSEGNGGGNGCVPNCPSGYSHVSFALTLTQPDAYTCIKN